MAVQELYAFGDFRLDVRERRLWGAGGVVQLPPKAFDLLVVLVRRCGRLTSKRELLTLVWPDAFVEMGVVSVHVSAVRKALGDTERPFRYVQTVSRSGYRFIASVQTLETAPAAAPAAPMRKTLYTRDAEAVSGSSAEARAIAEDLAACQARGCVHGYSRALIAAGLGEPKDMYRLLDEALSDRDAGLTFLRVEPRWRPYSTDPRFLAILERVGLPVTG